MSDPFASAAELSVFTGLTEPADLSRMQLLLELASAEVRRYTGQVLSVVANDQVVMPATDRDTLILPEWPVTAISQILVKAVAFTDYIFTKPGLIHRPSTWIDGDEGTGWFDGATVTYTHGYAETTDEYKAIKSVVMAAASRALTLNERSASEAMGSTLMESAGYAPEVFLTPGEKMQLADLSGKVLVG